MENNLDKEFEGIEECPICYYIVHSSTKELPKLPCKTCKHKFHCSCIHRWFNTSNKSECPVCKSQFLWLKCIKIKIIDFSLILKYKLKIK